jgi:peptidoglycan/LPS O-acetylase OafA/YrhL
MSVVFYGFLIVSDRRIIRVVERNRFAALVAAAILSSVVLLSELDKLSLPSPVFLALYATACWCWLIALIGIGSRLLNFTNRVLRYATDAVLPVYILHQTIIVTLGFYVIKWDTGVWPKYFLIAAATLILSVAIYEVVRRTVVTRFLFGIKSRKRPAPAQPASNLSGS